MKQPVCRGMINSKISSSAARHVVFSPVGILVTGRTRIPSAFLMTATASAAINAGTVSAAVAAFARFPPMVPLFRTWVEPTIAAASASIGHIFCTSALLAICEKVAMLPTCSPSSLASMFLSSDIAERSTSASSAIFPPFISIIKSVPPASAFTIPPDRIQTNASRKVAGL
ncbi:hypothetical protein SDC9_195026 [bioreactor metagenome]|uniref:Uncharacterized protein n=1 Tax=bioreactor metagenome TaxID=1076179 RepID=A0A645IGJ2_9ZZZZ